MKEIKCKSIITKSNLPNVDYCCNLYIGCTHKCSYCYATFMRRFTNHSEEWGEFVDVKINAPQILEKELRLKKIDKWIILGSVTDSYQPIEKKYLLTRECLNIFLKYQSSISILTKSKLILRDIDILKKFNHCEVGLSVSVVDESIIKKIEPYSASFSERINVLDILKKNKINTYAFIGPIIPNITNLREIFKKLNGKVDYVMGEFINLRCGSKENFVKSLLKIFTKEEVEEILSLIESDEYKNMIKREYNELCEKYHIINKGFFFH